MRKIFLRLIVAFSFVQNSSYNQYYAQKSAPRSSESSQTLVLAQEGVYRFGQTSPSQGAQDSCAAPQSGYFTITPDYPRNGHGTNLRCKPGLLPLEMSLWKDKQEMGQRMCSVLHTMVTRCPALYTTQESQEPRNANLEFLWMGRLGKLGRRSFEINKSIFDKVQFWCCQFIPFRQSSSSIAYQVQRQYEREERKERERAEQTERSGVAVSSGNEEFYTMDANGCLCLYAFDYAVSQPFHTFEPLGTRPGMGRSIEEGLPRPKYHAGRNTAFGRKSREGSWTQRHQKPAPGQYVPGQGQRPSERSLRTPEGAQSLMDEAHGSWRSDMGAAVRRVPETSILFDRTGCQGSERNRFYQSNYSAIESYSRWYGSHCSTDSSSRDGRLDGRHRGQRGGDHASEAASSSPQLRRVTGTRYGCGTEAGNYRGQRRQCWRQAAQAAAVLGAISQTFFVSQGHVLGVATNPRHEANPSSPSFGISSDAYWSSFAVTDAACWGTGTSFQPFLSARHSARQEPHFVDEYCAISNALCLQWEVSKNLYNDFCGDFANQGSPFCTVVPMLTSQRPHTKHAKGLQVKFEDQIDVWLGTDGSLEMFCISLPENAIKDWHDKPWSRKRTKPKSHSKTNVEAADCQAPLSNLAVLSRLSATEPETFRFSRAFPILTDEDEDSCLVQVTQFKHNMHSDQNAALLEAFSSGQVVATGDEVSEDGTDGLGDSDVNLDTSSASSGVRPPSSSHGRQEVIMFHLRDPPIRAFLDWSDYHKMISEIAFHFSTDPTNVVDAYEINTQLSGLPPDAIPIIVHLLPDIAIGQTARLVLFDLEIHAHSSEPSFRLGPATQRFVQTTPEWCDRDAILTIADAEVYCRKENDRCFVWYDGIRWPDTDVTRKQFAHGDHIRVALPPTERLACTTLDMVRWTQEGLSDMEILHLTTNHEASAGYSPSLLDEEEMHALATPNVLVDEDNEDFMAMQSSLVRQQSTEGSRSPSNDSVIPDDWYIDLQRIVRRHADQCNAAPHEQFLVSVYTWLLDHQDCRTCYQPKIVFLGDDPAEWYNDIIYPWRYHIATEEHVFLDIVQPDLPRAEVEEHIAHIILTKRPASLSSILLSLEFVEPRVPNVIVRFATSLSRQSTRLEIANSIPLFATLDDERLTWQHPALTRPDQPFPTHNGMGILIQVQPAQEATLEGLALPPLTDVTNLMQIGKIGAVSQLAFQEQKIDLDACKPSSCSLTDEFLEAVAAHQDAAQMERPLHLVPDPRTIEAQSESIRDLWERYQDAQTVMQENNRRGHRVESWFLNHATFTRCHESRIVLLQDDFLGWKQAFIHTWQDKLVNQDDISITIVHPLPEDAATGILSQVIVTQNPFPESRSAVLSVYDTDPDLERSPHTFALVLPQQIDLHSLLRFLNLLTDCTMPDQRNHCTLWFGRIPIASHNVVNVHAGHAFRLLVSRGEPVAIERLLAMGDQQIRDVLQRARQQEIFIRPDDPSFLLMEEMGPSQQRSQQNTPVDQRPDWIIALETLFNFHHVVVNIEDGPVLPVQVWYLNEHPDFHCGMPSAVELSSDSFMWRTEVIFPWRERLLRGTMTEVQVLPTPMQTIVGGQSRAQILVHQGLMENSCAVIVTLMGNHELRLQARRFAHVFMSRTRVREFIQFAVPEEHLHRPVIVQLNGRTYLPGEQMYLQSGNHVVVSVVEQEVDMFTEQIADGFSLQQQHMVVRQAARACKPAPFTDPDDLAMSLPVATPPRQPRPRHDGAYEWSFQLGEIMHTQGDLDPWDGSRSMEVVTWFIHHARRVVCHRPRTVRLFGHAVTWIDDLRNAWADIIDRSIPFSIHIVQPNPPQFRVQRTTCHILLEQGRTERHAAVVLTALLEGHANDGIIQSAHSVETRCNLPGLIRTMEISHVCIARQCSVLVGRTVLPGQDFFDVWSGLSLRIRIEIQEESQSASEVDRLHFEDLSLMQTNGACFQFNPDAPVFDPSLPILSVQPEWIQDLQRWWDQVAFSWEEETRTAKFLTWFVSPGTGRDRCLYSRRVTLFDDFLQWERAIRHVWIDALDPLQGVEFVLVMPPPEELETGIGGHIVLVQNPIEDRSSPLLTITDPLVHDGRSFRLVVTVVENSKPRDFLQASGYDRQCAWQGAHCQVRTAHQRLQDDSYTPVRDGDCIYLQITRMFFPHDWTPPFQPPEPGTEGLNFLQRQVRLSKAQRAHQNKQVRVIAWYLDASRPQCRIFRHTVVNEGRCMVKVAETLWDDHAKQQICHVFSVATMEQCHDADDGLEECCFLVVCEPPLLTAAVVLETMLDIGGKRTSEYLAVLVKKDATIDSLWSAAQGRPGLPSLDAVDVFVQGRPCRMTDWPALVSGSCITFGLDQRKLSELAIRIDFTDVLSAFDWLDTHLFMPQFDLQNNFPFLPCSLEWIQAWWDPSQGGQRLRVYFDGSHVSTEQGKQSGAAVAAFIQVHGTWYFAGAISTSLPPHSTSYSAELAASIIASKFAFDLLKLIQVSSGEQRVETTFCFDSLTAGCQASGQWNAFSAPNCGHLVRSLQKYPVSVRCSCALPACQGTCWRAGQ